MLFTVSKIIYKSGKSYLLFIFLATFLSLFSYILSSNIISSVDNYLRDQTKPLLWWDIVFWWWAEFNREYFLESYWDTLEIAQTIETQTTVFDENQNPILTSLIYHDSNYPIYDSFSYDIVNTSWSLIVDPLLAETFWESIEILWQEYPIKWIITGSPLWDFSAFSVSSSIYIPIELHNREDISAWARIEKKYYAWFLGEYKSDVVERVKRDGAFDEFRISSLDDRNENIGEITDRLWLFINFFNLIVFVLTFFIIILSLETFYKKLKKTLWLLTILGLSKGKMFLYNLLFIAVVFSLALLLATWMNYLTLIWLGNLYDFLMFYPGWVMQWILITWVLLLIWVYSPFYKIYSSRIQDMLNDSSYFSNFGILNYFVYLSLLFIWFYSISVISNIELFWAFIYSLWFTAGIIILYIFTNICLRIVYFLLKVKTKKISFYSFDALRSTIKPGNVSFFIVFSSFISFISIFIFYVFSGSFVSFITNFTQSSNDSFIVDISPNDIDITREYFSEDEIYTIIPMRISQINGISLELFSLENNLNPRLYSREFLSTTRDLSSDILVWDDLRSGWVSLDEEFAWELWVTLWDRILFSIAWLEKELTIVNIRKAVRSWATPFFYFSLLESDFDLFPKRYFVSYKSENKAENIQFEYSQAIGWNVTFINAKEIIEIVLDVADKILLIVYFCLVYVTVFSFLTFLVSIWFLKSFKNEKLKLMNILWGQKNKLQNAVVGEYIYLMWFWLLISLTFWTAWLVMFENFIDIFTIDSTAFLQWIWLVWVILLLMSVYLVLTKKTSYK